MKKESVMSIIRSKAKTALTPEEENMFGGFAEAIEQAFEQDTVKRNADLKTLTDKLGAFEEGETAASIIRSLATKVDAVEAKTKRSFSSEEKFKLKDLLREKKDEIMRSVKSGAEWGIEFRAKRAASAAMTTATVLTGASAYNTTNVFDDMEVAVIQYPKYFILDAISSRQVAKVPAYLRWKEQATAGDGVVGAVAEGGTKTLLDKKFVWKDATRVKYAGHIEFSEETEIDFDQLMIQIIDLFEQDVIRAWQNGVLTAITAWAPAYTSTALDDKIVKPTVYSVIGASKLCVQDANYEPDVVLINPGDAAEAIYLQDASGAQQFIPESLQFGGLTPFISNSVPVGTLYVGTKSVVKEQHGNYIVRRGTINDQLITNEATIVGEVFSILQLPTISKKAWCKSVIATVKAALLVPAV